MTAAASNFPANSECSPVRRITSHITRRHFGVISGGAIASLALGIACRSSSISNDGRLTERARLDVKTVASGEAALGLDRERDGILSLPAITSNAPLPLLVLLHGAGGSASGVLDGIGSVCSEAGVAVLAPDSRDHTWDAIGGNFGPDVTFLDRALKRVFDTVAVDPMRVAVGGFSDGATYALSLGLINGDLFSRVVAFSPGFIVDGTTRGNPRFFISHGTDDGILPIDRCSRLIVARLQKRGYAVTFREFHGGHEVPDEIAREGTQWVVTSSTA